MQIANDEVFGPVMSVMFWSDLGEAIRIANAVPLGLTAAVWSADHGTAQAVAHELEAGVVWVNTATARPVGMPFGGYKRSGVGREGNLDEVISYTREKAIISGTRSIHEG
jgi:acyl-CoA reductase-like NAD-dependent aldehyde dehydrogenase